jgi:hypothetical protein
VSITVPDGGIQQIDFLSSVAGLDTASIEARAVNLVLANGAPIRVLHPLDVLESRLRNLDLLPSKQNAVGRALLKLAVGVMAKFLRVLLVEESERVVLEAVERVAELPSIRGSRRCSWQKASISSTRCRSGDQLGALSRAPLAATPRSTKPTRKACAALMAAQSPEGWRDNSLPVTLRLARHRQDLGIEFEFARRGEGQS